MIRSDVDGRAGQDGVGAAAAVHHLARPRTTELKAVPSRLTEENGPLVVVECRLEDFGEGDPEWVRLTE